MTENSSHIITLPNEMNVVTVTASSKKLEGNHPLVLCQPCDQNNSFMSPMPIKCGKPKPIPINCDNTQPIPKLIPINCDDT